MNIYETILKSILVKFIIFILENNLLKLSSSQEIQHLLRQFLSNIHNLTDIFSEFLKTS